MAPVFQMFPEAGPLQLASRTTSGLLPFIVPSDAATMFLRLVAVGPGCESLGGAAPTIELRAGTGVMAPVPNGPVPASITDESGAEVGMASLTREAHDIFMVTLEISKKNTRLWRVRITNNDPEELGFVWVTAEDAEDTRQPRMQWSGSFQRSALPGEPIDNIVARVSNVGTGVLTFHDLPGTDLGGGFTLLKVPSDIAPNACGTLEIKVDPIPPSQPYQGPQEFGSEYELRCNDRNKKNATLRLVRSQKFGKEKEKEKEFKEKEGKEQKDKEGKDNFEDELMKAGDAFPLGTGPAREDAGSIARRLADLEQAVDRLAHFIGPELRPDTSMSPLANEGRVQRGWGGTRPAGDAKGMSERGKPQSER
ncbi:hypothetical protein QWM81_17575 [Streptomyces ficellus]|uniref:Uncharacterized protein n=1 Tax=Streptomyces ficellus TaxID=1977088 RepID=A0ABT7Z976_9ACTN|nr:hypothetical protein [Streptomyces ficellus]MDN3295827.1 hypothetical protein [Streptomyces ficellus]